MMRSFEVSPGQRRGNGSNRKRGVRILPSHPTEEAVAKGLWALCFVSTIMCLTLHGSCLDGGRCSNSLVCSLTPFSFHGSLQSAGTLMALKCLTRAHTISIDLDFSQKEDRGALTHSGWQLLGPSELWSLQNTRECGSGQSSFVVSTATHLFAKGPKE